MFSIIIIIKKHCMYVGFCMPVCSCVCSRVAYVYVKPNLSAYAIHMVPHIRNWLIRSCTIFILGHFSASRNSNRNTYKQLNNIIMKIPLTELSTNGAVSLSDCPLFGQCP